MERVERVRKVHGVAIRVVCHRRRAFLSNKEGKEYGIPASRMSSAREVCAWTFLFVFVCLYVL